MSDLGKDFFKYSYNPYDPMGNSGCGMVVGALLLVIILITTFV